MRRIRLPYLSDTQDELIEHWKSTTCAPSTSATDSAAASGPAPSSAGAPSTPSTTMRGAATACALKPLPAGGPACASSAPTSPTGTPPRPEWMEQWICSQRDSLAAMCPPPGAGRASPAPVRDQLGGGYSAQLTIFDLPGCSLKTALGSAPEGAASSPEPSWREDTAGETEPLLRLMSARPTSACDGFFTRSAPTLVRADGNGHAQFRGIGAAAARPNAGTTLPGFLRHLPTLLAADGRDPGISATRQGSQGLSVVLRLLPTLTCSEGIRSGVLETRAAGGRKQMHLATALHLLPTLCATDFKSPYSAEGYERQTLKRSKPLRDTAAHTIGIRLSPAFCLWWMGWPIGALQSLVSATPGCRSKPRPHGACSEGRE